ncbi:MAG: AcrR family transcriptional regulator [Paracoccaceae bacterium]|jgi:AcrR family transcriptional regulator
MRDDKRKIRHDEITQAAYGLLATKGYDGTSMLSIAKTAKASNETLYRWYGDKRGLFVAMVRDNAANVKIILEEAVAEQIDPIETLRNISPVLLTMLLGEKAILLNRAATADPTGGLGAAISEGGRNVIQPLLAKLIEEIGAQHGVDAQMLSDCYIGLLIGDLQIKRAIGVLPVPDKSQIEDRSQMAFAVFLKLIQRD